MNTLSPPVLLVTACLLTGAVGTLYSQSAKTFIPYDDVRPIIDALRVDLVPAEIRDKGDGERQALWPGWVSRADAMIRARVEGGDEDSIIHLLLFGTSFTKAPRAADRDLAALVSRPDEGLVALRPRMQDFAAAIESPGTNDRLQFARRVVERRGIAPTTDAGRVQLRRYLDERTRVVGGSVQSSRLLDPGAELTDKLTLFRDRGLSTDTSIFIDFGIEQAIEAMKAGGVVRPRTIRRVAIVGPGLDFADKLEGYDFYPEQTIQPFALVESLLRLDLAELDNLQVSALDLSPRVLQHLEAARTRARAGTPYSVTLPRNTERPWSADLVDYWQRFGNWIGSAAERVPPVPPGAGRAEARGVSIRPPVVLSIVPLDLNIVTERLDESPPAEPFDLVVATNILLYYGVFEQSLAATNIARMLRPGGILLTNNRIFELPQIPLSGVGYTDVTYMSLSGIGETGDRVVWYRKQ